MHLRLMYVNWSGPHLTPFTVSGVPAVQQGARPFSIPPQCALLDAVSPSLPTIYDAISDMAHGSPMSLYS